MKIAVLVSGSLGLQVLKDILTYQKPIFVATDSKSTSIYEFCDQHGIPCFKGNPRNRKLSEFMIKSHLEADILLSINYLFLIERDVLERIPSAINFHGSLLPSYRGRTPHVWAIINNETKTGITAHYIDEGCDTGDIVLQKEIQIDEHMTGADVLNTYVILYPAMVREVITLLQSGTVVRQKQDESKAIYFGKRTPDDGAISWSWQKERIRNWVRAQAFPYPGAFTHVSEKGNKIIIDEILFTDRGYHQDQQDGLVVGKEVGNLYVKTSNGVIKLSKIRNVEILETVKVGDILYNKPL